MPVSADQSTVAEAVRQALRQDERIAEIAHLAADRGIDVYVVGGFIRDVVLSRPSQDVDFAVEGAADFARDFSARVRGTYVLLHEQHETARVVVNEWVYDFADLRGESIADDLALRDFTLNAEAYALPTAEGNGGAILDPLDGLADIRAQIVRAASTTAMRDDAVRIVRAFRFAAELGFAIEEGTTALAADATGGLRDVAGERVRVELFKVLEVPQAVPFVRQMDELGVVEALLPELAETKGAVQDDRHHLDVWEHSMATLEQVEETLCHLERHFPDYAGEMRRFVEQNAVIPVLKLAALLHDVAKPLVRSKDDDGRPVFTGHSAEGAQMAERIANRLRMSRRDRQALVGLVGHHRRPIDLLEVAARGELRARRMARYFRTTGHHGIGLLRRSTSSPSRTPTSPGPPPRA